MMMTCKIVVFQTTYQYTFAYLLHIWKSNFLIDISYTIGGVFQCIQSCSKISFCQQCIPSLWVKLDAVSLNYP
ncbi:hypothetical protein T01_14572 [Trichinella spiralis]|uniref:Uncharacterized protein n=1 Tax=Trichinella spiralis TaxID=6334 RepID=A0A0V1BGD1_TRISP|nr:hypothetical protein T01_14572 [Trichinella spiralis]